MDQADMANSMDFFVNNILNCFAVEIGESNDEPIYRLSVPTYFMTDEQGKGVLSAGHVAEGDTLQAMACARENIQDRVSKVAAQLLKSSGWRAADIRGALAIMCGSNIMVGGPDSM